MASFYQKPTGLRRPNDAGRNENIKYWPTVNGEASTHYRGGSDPRDEQAAVVPNRSRSHTMTSAMSFYAASNSDSSTTPSRAPSPHLTRDKFIPTMEKKDNTAKTLLSKGSRMLRKHGSKFSLSSLYTVDSDTSHKYMDRPVTAHTGTVSGTKSCHSGVEAVKREDLKRTISEPFDFQHVTHTDRVFLNSMQRVSKTELVGEFSALRAGQASKPQLRGIRAEALPAKRPSDSLPASPVSKSENSIESSLPQTPPRPTPPPKDAAMSPLSPAQPIHMSRSFDNFSRPASSSSISPITPPRRYSSRRALQPSLLSPIRPLGAHRQSPSHSVAAFDAFDANSPKDVYEHCQELDVASAKPPSVLPTIHAVTTNDDSARQLRIAPLPRTPLDLADVPEEDEMKRQSLLRPRNEVSMPLPGSFLNKPALATSPAMEEKGVDESKVVFSEQAVVDDWDDAIDYSWDRAAEFETIITQSPVSMTGRVASFVDKAMTRLAGSEYGANASCNKEGPATNSPPTKPSDVTPESGMMSISTRAPTLPNRSGASPLLGLGIEVTQPWQEVLEACPTPTPGVASLPREANERDSTLTTYVNSDFGAASMISKSSSQESIILSIASSIMGTSRSSNSSNSWLEQLPDCSHASKSIDDLREALESVQHLQEIHEQDEQSTTDSLARHSSSAMQSHRRARTLATGTTSSGDLKDMPMLRPTTSNSGSPRASYGHSRVHSGSRIPIPTRMSSVQQPKMIRPPACRMRSATTTARSRPASRASVSYSLFPGAPAIGA